MLVFGNGFKLTTKGKQMVSSGASYSFSKIVLGAGTYTSAEDATTRTALKAQKQSFDVSDTAIDGSIVTIAGVITNASLAVGYTITEAGVIAKDSTGAEHLFLIGVATLSDPMPAHSDNIPDVICDMKIKYTTSNTSKVSLSVPETAYARAVDLKAVNSKLAQKANNNSIFSMANMGQDVKEAMTNGSVAVVGKNTVLEDNIVWGQITPPTTNFMVGTGNLIDNSYFNISKGKYINGTTGLISTAVNEFYAAIENFIPVTVGKTYVFNSSISWMYCYDRGKNFISRIATIDCSSTWKRATVPEGVSYVRIYCDTSKSTYTKIYFFEYDDTIQYTTNGPADDKLPKTEYIINNLSLSENQKNTVKNEIKSDLENLLVHRKISDISSLIFNGCNIKLIGDSITAGQGGTNFNKNFNTSGGELITDKIWKKTWYTNDTGHCWANTLKEYLTQKFNCTVKNYGCPGIGAADILTAIDDLVREDDDIVICMIGTNNRHHFPIDQFYPLLKQVYETITVVKNKKCIMISCMPASVTNETSNNRLFHTDDIDNMYYKLSCEYNFEYISLYKEILKFCATKGINIDTLLNTDGLHPNDEGYDVMFMIICMFLGFAPKRNGATW